MPYLTYTAENLIMPPAHHGYVRRMAVADMPDTRCKRSLLLRIENPETAVVTIVARWNYDGSWEAYIGWPRDAHFNQGVIEGYGETYIRAVVTHTLTARGTASHGTVIQGDDALAPLPRAVDARSLRNTEGPGVLGPFCFRIAGNTRFRGVNHIRGAHDTIV